MRQFSVTCSNVFSNQSSSSFENELAQPLDFGRAAKEDWRVSLVELSYAPHQFHNIRTSNNTMDIVIRDWYYPIYSPHNVEYAGWEVPDKAQYFNKPIVKSKRARSLADTIEWKDVDSLRPGQYAVFRGSTAPHILLYFYWHVDALGLRDD